MLFPATRRWGNTVRGVGGGGGRARGEGGGEFTRLFLEEKGARAGIKENLDPDITAEFFSYLGLYTF